MAIRANPIVGDDLLTRRLPPFKGGAAHVRDKHDAWQVHQPSAKVIGHEAGFRQLYGPRGDSTSVSYSHAIWTRGVIIGSE